MQLTYYLIIQDRINEALNNFNRIKKEEIDDNNKSYKIQYDYTYAYLDFTFGYPEFKIAKSIYNNYKDFPLLYWKEKFQDIEEELLEYKNKSYKIQYDYIYSYLDFTFGYPEFKIAKSICNNYKDFPLLHWKEKFEEIEEELLEY